MNDWNVLDKWATGEGRPIKSMGVNEIEFSSTLAQLEEKFQEEIGLGKKTGVSGTFLLGIGKVSRLYARWDRDRLNGDTGYR
jgi:hypothetical protein